MTADCVEWVLRDLGVVESDLTEDPRKALGAKCDAKHYLFGRKNADGTVSAMHLEAKSALGLREHGIAFLYLGVCSAASFMLALVRLKKLLSCRAAVTVEQEPLMDV
eukprot:gnl/TRDRNA2_/TRDRNA2_41392_c1_seq1.p1 gnl/TRDRNA2_/TRDRNA2_41392_c1~~gnl/TRDRNA2_/TRDRNA2_41392_c1_seq1.p1  ORF type:complete len:107 (-),score=15.98 gnl/TRDRNA2_/TRDRNA2_41392_c1_seq1:191-511(-)